MCYMISEPLQIISHSGKSYLSCKYNENIWVWVLVITKLTSHNYIVDINTTCDISNVNRIVGSIHFKSDFEEEKVKHSPSNSLWFGWCEEKKKWYTPISDYSRDIKKYATMSDDGKIIFD